MKYDPHRYRVIFCGSAPISAGFLQWLYEDARYELVGVVTMPDQAQGRGMKVQPNIIKQTTHQLDAIIPVFTPRSLRLDSRKYADDAVQFKTDFESLQADLVVVVAYGNIIPQWMLDGTSFGCFNIHGSVLPKYRGASPLQDIFLHNEKESGITLMKMDAWVDTGPIIDIKTTKILHTRTVVDLIDWIKDMGPRFLCTKLWEYLKGELSDQPQDNATATECSKIAKEDGLVDLAHDTLGTIYCKWRAYILWPHTYFMRTRSDGSHIQVTIIDLQIREEYDYDRCLYDGSTLHPDIISFTVRPANKKSMSWEDFMKGYI
jgi:methionyl-tRNA formyltransferase